MTQIQKIFKWGTLVFFTVVILTLTIGQEIPLEISNSIVMRFFYDVLLLGLPVVTLLTYVWTYNKGKSFGRNLRVGLLTGLIACIAFFLMVMLMFSCEYSAWETEEVIYESRSNPNVTISYQVQYDHFFDDPSFRIVKLTPVLYMWVWVEEVETTEMDKSKWALVERERDIKFP